MKIISLLACFFLFLVACDTASTVKEISHIDVAMDSYRSFLEEFEEELKNAIAGGATSDEWESAIQTLLSNSLESNNEIQRQWNKEEYNKGTAEYDGNLGKWLKLELKRFELEKSVLTAWHNVEVNSLSEAMLELAQAETAMNEELVEEGSLSSKVLKNILTEESDMGIEVVKERILKLQLETDSLFGEALNQLSDRRKQLEENPSSLVN